MNSLVAWSPVKEGNGPLIFSVLVNDQQKLTDHIYLNLLGERIQRLIDRSPNPKAAGQRLQELLDQAGLINSPQTLYPGNQANQLVTSNPSVEARLDALDLPMDLTSLTLVEMLSARKELQADKSDPLNRLDDWASAVSVMR